MTIARDPAPATTSRVPIDLHVHLLGNGSSGSGCWLKITGWHRPLAAFMVRHIGLPSAALHGNLDELYVERLRHFVRTSSLGAVGLLAQDLVYDDTGRRREGVGSFYVPNTYVLALAKQHREFLPVVSIHPARPDAFEELERCLEGGAVMMKCLPNCHNIDCNNPRYRQFWERMAEARLPLLAHTGGEHTVPVVRRELSDPRTLRLPLECGVTVIAAHCGTKSGLFDRDYFHLFLEMTRQYPNLYGDNSAFSVPIRGRHTPECLRSPLAERILHGSDFPVPVLAHWALLRGFIGWRDFRRCQAIDNPIERDHQLKRAMGYAPETFTRIHHLLHRNVAVD